MNFSDEGLPHEFSRAQRRSSSSSSSSSASRPARQQARVVVTSPVEEKDDQFETLLNLIGTGSSPAREEAEGKGFDSVGGLREGKVGEETPHLGGAPAAANANRTNRANGRFMEGLGVGRPPQPASLLPPARPSTKPSRLSSYSSIPIPPSSTLRPEGATSPPRRPHSVASGERPTIISSASPSLFPLPRTPPPIQAPAVVPAAATPLLPIPQVASIPSHSRNASASSSNSATSVVYRMVGPPPVVKADLTIELDPFGAQASPDKEDIRDEGQDDDSFSSSEESSSSEAEHVERLLLSSTNTLPPQQPNRHSEHLHQNSLSSSLGSPTLTHHLQSFQQSSTQTHPTLPADYPPSQSHLPSRHPQNIFQPPYLPPSAALDFNSFEPPGGTPPAYPPPEASRKTSLTMQIAQSEGWAVDGDVEEHPGGVSGASSVSEAGGGGDGTYEDQREFLTRPLGLLALSQALSAANDEVDALRSVVRDVTGLVHAQAQDAFVQARLQQKQQQRQRQDRSEGGAGWLTEREVDELSGSEAREMLKSLTTPSSLPTHITSSLSLIKHFFELAASTGEVPAEGDERGIYSDANLERLAGVVQGWKERR